VLILGIAGGCVTSSPFYDSGL